MKHPRLDSRLTRTSLRETWRRFTAFACAFAMTSWVEYSLAAPNDVVVERTRVEAPEVQRAPPEPDLDSVSLAQRVDAIIYEAVQDLGLSLDISRRGSSSDRLNPEELLEVPPQSWILVPVITRSFGRLVLEISAAPPGSRVLFVRSQTIAPEDVEMRVVTMVRDLVQAARGAPAAPLDTPKSTAKVITATPARSPGRAILALNGALLGGFVGYSIQEASGSDDDRLTYPLAALGAGVGVGGSLLVAEEWDIGNGDAWFLSAGMWWPTFSAWFISQSYDVASEDRYAYGLLGATAGITLSTLALGLGHISEGGAALTHSGAAFGTLLGGVSELLVEGRTDLTPHRGMGYGAAAGFLVAGTLATRLSLSATRVLMIDLGASLGALAGAAVASPLLFVEGSQEIGQGRSRLWLASVAAGTLAGGAIGVWSTRAPIAIAGWQPPFLPSVGILPGSGDVPAYGGSVFGSW